MTFTNQSMDHEINIETAFAGRFCQPDTVLGIFSVLAPAGPMTHSLTTTCSVMMTDQFAGFARRIVQPLQSEVE